MTNRKEDTLSEENEGCKPEETQKLENRVVTWIKWFINEQGMAIAFFVILVVFWEVYTRVSESTSLYSACTQRDR